jgi:uncharacterized protein (TIGR03085 family)
MHPSRSERAALCDLFDELGPGAPTIPDGWQARDLAAHLWVRERRPDAAPGLLGRGPFAGRTERLQDAAAERPFAEVVADLRGGPPKRWFGHWVPAGDLHEWFVHHEDVRRANGLAPREDDRLDDAIWGALGMWGRILVRRADVGVELVAHDGRRRTAKAGDPAVTLTGRPGELLLTLFGRDAVAEVEVHGTDDAVAAWRRSDIGL